MLLEVFFSDINSQPISRLNIHCSNGRFLVCSIFSISRNPQFGGVKFQVNAAFKVRI